MARAPPRVSAVAPPPRPSTRPSRCHRPAAHPPRRWRAAARRGRLAAAAAVVVSTPIIVAAAVAVVAVAAPAAGGLPPPALDSSWVRGGPPVSCGPAGWGTLPAVPPAEPVAGDGARVTDRGCWRAPPPRRRRRRRPECPPPPRPGGSRAQAHRWERHARRRRAPLGRRGGTSAPALSTAAAAAAATGGDAAPPPPAWDRRADAACPGHRETSAGHTRGGQGRREGGGRRGARRSGGARLPWPPRATRRTCALAPSRVGARPRRASPPRPPQAGRPPHAVQRICDRPCGCATGSGAGDGARAVRPAPSRPLQPSAPSAVRTETDHPHRRRPVRPLTTVYARKVEGKATGVGVGSPARSPLALCPAAGL